MSREPKEVGRASGVLTAMVALSPTAAFAAEHNGGRRLGGGHDGGTSGHSFSGEGSAGECGHYGGRGCGGHYYGGGFGQSY